MGSPIARGQQISSAERMPSHCRRFYPSLRSVHAGSQAAADAGACTLAQPEGMRAWHATPLQVMLRSVLKSEVAGASLERQTGREQKYRVPGQKWQGVSPEHC